MNIKLFFKYILLITLSIGISSCSYFNKDKEENDNKEIEKEVIKKNDFVEDTAWMREDSDVDIAINLENESMLGK